MDIALAEARAALTRGEVPVGCALQNALGEIVATGSNRTNELGNATAHAEMMAFQSLQHDVAHEKLTLFVTCEPCVMCAAAIVQMRFVTRVVFGCANPRFGGCRSIRSMSLYGGEKVCVIGGVKAAEAVRLLELFYENTNPNAPKPKKRRVKK